MRGSKRSHGQGLDGGCAEGSEKSLLRNHTYVSLHHQREECVFTEDILKNINK